MILKKCKKIVKSEVDKGTILLRTEDEMANTIRSYTVVEVDGKMAGFTALHIHSRRLSEVRSLIISEKFRGLKLGKKLVEACIEEGIKLGLKQIYL